MSTPWTPACRGAHIEDLGIARIVTSALRAILQNSRYEYAIFDANGQVVEDVTGKLIRHGILDAAS